MSKKIIHHISPFKEDNKYDISVVLVHIKAPYSFIYNAAKDCCKPRILGFVPFLVKESVNMYSSTKGLMVFVWRGGILLRLAERTAGPVTIRITAAWKCVSSTEGARDGISEGSAAPRVDPRQQEGVTVTRQNTTHFKYELLRHQTSLEAEICTYFKKIY